MDLRILRPVITRGCLLFITAATLVFGCRSKDDAPIDIPLPAEPSGSPITAAPSGAAPSSAAATTRPQEPRRPASSSADPLDPSSTGGPAPKPKSTGRPISTQL